MENVKAALSSRTIWGSIVTALVPLLALAGISVSVADQSVIVDIIIAVVGCVGAIMTAVGRLRATHRIGGVVTPNPAKAPRPSPE